MSKEKQFQLENLLEEHLVKIQKLENLLIKYQNDLKDLEVNFEITLDELKVAQTQHNMIQEELYKVKQENFKNIFQINKIKNIFEKNIPMLDKIKNKAKEKISKVKDYIDGTYFDKAWMDQHYEQYKKYCIEKGQEIKRREDFEKMMSYFQNIKDDSEDLNLYEILNKVSGEFSSAKETLSNSINNLKEKALEKNQKKKTFEKWIAYFDLTENEDEYSDIKDLYEKYKNYCENFHSSEPYFLYSNGNFSSQIKKYYTNLIEIKKDGKEIKLVNLKQKLI
jgi:hypothetical protein